MSATPTSDLLSVNHLVVEFPTRGMSTVRGGARKVRALNDISFAVRRGETLGLIGESGSGKSTIARTIMSIYRPASGTILFDGRDIFQARSSERSQMRRKMQMVFQNPYSAVNRRFTVQQVIAEPLNVQRIGSSSSRAARAKELLELVGLPAEFVDRYPHELSGGQMQRVGLARALATGPELLIADEPTAALDVSVRSQVLDLLSSLKDSLGLSLLYISHDLSTVSYLADRVAVLFKGEIVEFNDARSIERRPQHPYTQRLLAAVPRVQYKLIG